MYNLYQSQLRQDIQTKVYHRPTMQVSLFGKEYFALLKHKSFGPLKAQWIQIMGVQLPDDEKYVRAELQRVKKELKKKQTNVLLQLGIINEIISFKNVAQRSQDFESDMHHLRHNLQRFFKKIYGFKPSFRENMPMSNIIIDVKKPDEELLQDMHSGSKQHIKKAIGKKLEFSVASPDHYESFYKSRKATSGAKGFNIIPYDEFIRLVTYLTQEKRGNLFITRMGEDIVSGSICLYDGKTIIYLYGFANRAFGNIGSHHYLKYHMFSWAREHGFTSFDLMGGAPTGFPDHHLAGVSAFKESLGGTKIELYGSYDIPLNPLLYHLFKRYQKLRK